MTTTKKSKVERLRAAGWSVGDAAQFLGLSEEERAFVELKLRLAEAIRLARSSRGWTQAALAKRIRSSQSRIAKIEVGDPSVSLELMFRAAFGLGLSLGDLLKPAPSLRRSRALKTNAG
ncbi:MAG: helix-turn-helix transcriptional regulator [Planctomycetaceae bacterium]|nr:helix-turn-helix transcriptional regulator [Planctomycetaceae bacterium]